MLSQKPTLYLRALDEMVRTLFQFNQRFWIRTQPWTHSCVKFSRESFTVHCGSFCLEWLVSAVVCKGYPISTGKNQDCRSSKTTYHLKIGLRWRVLFSRSTSIPPLSKNSLAAHLNSSATLQGEKNRTFGLDFVPLQSPKWIKGFILTTATYSIVRISE